MSKNTKHKLYKSLLSLHRKEDEIIEAQRNLGYRKLEKPIPHGFVAYFALREDIARRDDAHIYQWLIDNFSTTPWTNDGVTYYVRKGFIYDNRPKLQHITETYYLKLSEKMKKFFYHDTTKDKAMWNGEIMRKYKCYIEPHFLTIKVKRDFKTHQKVIDSELEREYSYNRKQLWKIWHTFEPYDSHIKPFGKAKNRSDRRYNKVALRKNLNSQIIEFGDWLDWSTNSNITYDPHEFTYKTRHGARWDRW